MTKVEKDEMMAYAIDVNLGFDKISKEHRLEDLMDYLTDEGVKNFIKFADDDYSTEEYIGWLSDDQIKRVFWLSDDIDNDSETLNGLVSHRPELALEVSLTNKASFLAVLLQKDISKLIELLNTTKDSLDSADGGDKLNYKIFTLIVKHLDLHDLFTLYEKHEWIFNQDVTILPTKDYFNFYYTTTTKNLIVYYLQLPKHIKTTVKNFGFLNYYFGLTDDYTPDKNDIFFVAMDSFIAGQFNFEFDFIDSVYEFTILRRYPPNLIKQFILSHKEFLKTNYYFNTLAGTLGLVDSFENALNWLQKTVVILFDHKKPHKLPIIREFIGMFFTGLGELVVKFDVNKLTDVITVIAEKDQSAFSRLGVIRNPILRKVLLSTGNLQAKL